MLPEMLPDTKWIIWGIVANSLSALIAILVSMYIFNTSPSRFTQKDAQVIMNQLLLNREAILSLREDVVDVKAEAAR